MKPTPQASCSNQGSYNPCLAGGPNNGVPWVEVTRFRFVVLCIGLSGSLYPFKILTFFAKAWRVCNSALDYSTALFAETPALMRTGREMQQRRGKLTPPATQVTRKDGRRWQPAQSAENSAAFVQENTLKHHLQRLGI